MIHRFESDLAHQTYNGDIMFNTGDEVKITDKSNRYYELVGKVVGFLTEGHTVVYDLEIPELDFIIHFSQHDLELVKAKLVVFNVGDIVRLDIPGSSLNKKIVVISKLLDDGRVYVQIGERNWRLNTNCLTHYKKVEAEEVPFYVVWNPDGHNCAQKYTEVKDALKNAESRTSTYEGECEYYVLRVVKKFSKKMVKDSFEYSKED